jgi:hypothetical protein
LLVEAGRVGFRAQLDRHISVHVGLAARVAPLEIDHHCVAVIDAAPFDRLESPGALAQPLHRELHRFVADRGRRPPEGNRRHIARVERRQRVERCREGKRLSFLDADVADVGRVDRLQSFLAQRIVDGARNQIVRDVVQDLVLEALLDHARRRLAGAEAGHARAARVVACDAIDLAVDDFGRDLDAHRLARRVDVGEFGLHRGKVAAVTIHRATASCPRGVRWLSLL